MLGRLFDWVSTTVGVRSKLAEPTYREQMQAALAKLRVAEMQLAAATSLEELDLGRSALQQAYAEVQHLVRSAKREQGVPLRTINECEEMHRNLVESLHGRRSRSRKVQHTAS